MTGSVTAEPVDARRDEIARAGRIAALERALGREALIEHASMQPGDVEETWADISPLQRDHGYAPKTTIAEGIPRFVAWYRDHYGV